MDENTVALLDSKNEIIEAQQTRLKSLKSLYLQQKAYIALLEAALEQYNIELNIRGSNLSTTKVN